MKRVSETAECDAVRNYRNRFSFFFQSDFTDLHFQHNLLLTTVARSVTSII